MLSPPLPEFLAGKAFSSAKVLIIPDTYDYEPPIDLIAPFSFLAETEVFLLSSYREPVMKLYYPSQR